MIEFSLPRKFSAESYCQNQVMLKERERDTPTKEREKKNPNLEACVLSYQGQAVRRAAIPAQSKESCTAFPLGSGYHPLPSH